MTDEKKLTPQERYEAAVRAHEDASELLAFAQGVADYNRARDAADAATDAMLDAVDDGAVPE